MQNLFKINIFIYINRNFVNLFIQTEVFNVYFLDIWKVEFYHCYFVFLRYKFMILFDMLTNFSDAIK
ncbi:hypothetical protein SDC9_181821 [bioreactor metagenome]|uniref:Uncharacterized protein n=1 Tax=bioreactor metagenome TaxID=1076179 RepID=A0A645H5Q6_9ZZZZ